MKDQNASVSLRDALDIVFQNRNRDYGAYQIRRSYDRTMGRALFGGVFLIGLSFGVPHLLSKVSGVFERKTVDIVVCFKEEGKIEVDKLPAPPKIEFPTPPPPMATTAFVAPRIVDNAEPEKTQVDIEELKETKAAISNKTQLGSEDIPEEIVEIPIPKYIEAPKPTPMVDDEIHDFVEKSPAFPGGEAELLAFLNKNINYPAMAKETGVQGTVVISFVVNKKGDIEDLKILKDIGGGCAKEAMRVVNAMPRWNAGEQQGNPVKVRFTLPIRFQLQ
jgi:periplasmic protein TonB